MGRHEFQRLPSEFHKQWFSGLAGAENTGPGDLTGGIWRRSEILYTNFGL